MATTVARLLILCKTYPTPSAKYAETSCVAALNESGQFVRLFPVPFRLISDEQQFRKWQWIEARIEKSNADHRVESHRVFVDTIKVTDEPIQAGRKGWPLRMELLRSAPTFSSFEAMEQSRQRDGHTLALLKPSRILSFEIRPAKELQWSEAELANLTSWTRQDSLFSEPTSSGKSLKVLDKLPFDFYYYCEFNVDGVIENRRIKLVDWEVGALYRNLVRAHGSEAWERPFRQKYEEELPVTCPLQTCQSKVEVQVQG